MTNIFLKEESVKAQMISEILKHSDNYNSKKELAAKNFSVVKYMYYDYVKSTYQSHRLAS